MTKAMKRAGAVLGWLLWGTVHAGTVTYIHTDAQGTPVMESDAQGHITARFEYTPYGVPVTSVGAAPDGVGYTGHVNDPETGLVYMQQRYYDAEAGRFLSVDPVVSVSGSRYAYVNNNPLRYIDPDGRQAAQQGGQNDPEDPDPCDLKCKQQRQEERRQKNNEVFTGGVVAKAVGERLLKMAAAGAIKKISPSSIRPWIGVLSKAISASKRAKDWGMVFAETNDITLKSGLIDINFYKDSGTIPPTGRVYYFSAVPWGGVDWGPYDNSSYSLAPEQVWDNFVHDRKATDGESK